MGRGLGVGLIIGYLVAENAWLRGMLDSQPKTGSLKTANGQ